MYTTKALNELHNTLNIHEIDLPLRNKKLFTLRHILLLIGLYMFNVQKIMYDFLLTDAKLVNGVHLSYPSIIKTLLQ